MLGFKNSGMSKNSETSTFVHDNLHHYFFEFSWREQKSDQSINWK